MNAITTSHDFSAARIRRVVRERKRMIFGVAAAFATAGALVAYFTPPVYRATARVEFRTPEERQPWTGQGRSTNYQSENAARTVAPILAVSPARHGADQQQDHDNQQDQSHRSRPFQKWLSSVQPDGEDRNDQCRRRPVTNRAGE